MDEFTNVVAPVIMINLTKNDKNEKKEIQRKRLIKKNKNPEAFEDELSAVYVHENAMNPITYNRPRSRVIYH